MNLPKQQRVDKIVKVPLKIVHITYECYLYLSVAKFTKSNSSVNAVCHKRTADRLKQMAENEAVKRKRGNSKEWFTGDYTNACQVYDAPHSLAFSEMTPAFEITWAEYLGRINVAKHHAKTVTGDAERVHSAVYQ